MASSRTLFLTSQKLSSGFNRSHGYRSFLQGRNRTADTSDQVVGKIPIKLRGQIPIHDRKYSSLH